MKKKLSITPEILDRVIYGMENQKEQLFLDPSNGTLKPAGTADNLIPMPPWDSSRGFRLMDQFIVTLPDKELAHRLKEALSGRGAFRRFKEIMAERPLNQQLWRQFRKRAMQREAYNWLSRWSDALELEDLPPEPEDLEELAAMEFTIRQATDIDMQLLSRLDLDAWCERYPGLKMRYREKAVLRERCFLDTDGIVDEVDKMNPVDILVAEALDGQMAGFGWMYVVDGEGWLLQLYVLPKFRGMGLGTLLLESCIGMAQERGAVRLGVYQTESGYFFTDWLKRNDFCQEVVAWTR